MLMIPIPCDSDLPSRPPRCCSHHGDPRRERRVQLPGGLSRRHPGAVRVAVGEEGRRNGTTAHTPLLQYNAAHLPCVCFCSVKVGSSPRRALQTVKYMLTLCRLRHLVLSRGSGNAWAPRAGGLPRRPRPARALRTHLCISASSAYCLVYYRARRPTDRATRHHSDKGLQSESERAADPR